MSTVVVRTDASSELGTGHLMRCLALCEALAERGAEPILATRTRIPALLERARRVVARIEIIDDPSRGDADRTVRIAREAGADWIVLDGYHFDAGYRERVQGRGAAVLCIDDHGVEAYACDLVVNGNLYAEGHPYTTSARTRVLAGPAYALLRREFRAPRSAGFAGAPGSRILVTLGGSDAGGHVVTVLEALRSALRGGEQVRVIVGPAADPDVARRAAAALPVPTTVLHGVDQMAPHMRWADHCITAAGSICLEYACMGVPMAAGIVADNQIRVAQAVEALGLGIDLGWLGGAPGNGAEARAPRAVSSRLPGTLAAWLADHETRRQQARVGPALVDGAGATRIAEQMLDALGRAAHAGTHA